MGYVSKFLHGVEYNAQDFNNIIRKLATRGVSIEYEDVIEDGEPTDLNAIMELLATEGVLRDNCKVIKIDDTAKVLTGVIIMINGSTIEVDSEGVIFPLESGVKNYIFARTETNSNVILCSTTAPQFNDVPLAEIDTDGKVIDKRQYSSGKLIGFGSNFIEKINVIKTYPPNPETLPPGSLAGAHLVDTIPLLRGNYKGLTFINNKTNNNDTFLGSADLQNQLYTFAIPNAYGIKYTPDGFRIQKAYTDHALKFILNGSTLEVWRASRFDSGNYSADYTIEVY